MGDVVYTATLGAATVPLASEFDPSTLTWEAEVFGDGRALVPRVARVKPAGVRTMPLPIVFEGATDTVLESARSALNAELSKANVLTFTKTADGVQQVLSFATYPSSPIPAVITPLARFGYRVKTVMTIQVEPFAELGPVTIPTAGIDAVGQVDISDPFGEYAPPLKITVAKGGADDFHSVYIGCCSDPSFTDWWVWAAAGVDGWDNGATLNGDPCRSFTVDDWGVWDTALFPEGNYLLLAQVWGNGSVHATAGPGAIPLGDDVAFNRASPHWVEVGEVALPTARILTGATVVAPLNVSCYAAAGTVYCFRLALLRLDEGFAAWHPATATTGTDQLVIDEGIFYVGGIEDRSAAVGGAVVFNGPGKIWVLAEPVTETDIHYDVDVTVEGKTLADWFME